MNGSRRESTTATLLGVAALLLWASLVAVSRGLRGSMGVLPSAALANLAGGAIGLAIGPARAGRMRHLLRLPPKYLFGCGGLFVLYNLALFPAIDRATTHAQTIEVALVNYLWPALSVAGTVVVLRKRASGWLWLGLAIATAGAMWAASGGSLSLRSLHEGLTTHPLPYLLALVAAVSWALYSNLARKWGGRAGENAAPLFLVASGVGLFVLHAAARHALWIPLTPHSLAQLAYLTLFPTLLAYVFWDRAMRQGNIVLVTSLSFFTPLLSTLISCVYLGMPMRPDLLIAAGLPITPN